MDQIRNRNTNSTRFAVNRVYQPARIERELLAQVFDLVERGVDKHFEPSDDGQTPAVIAFSIPSTDLVAASIVGADNQTPIIELEEVA